MRSRFGLFLGLGCFLLAGLPALAAEDYEMVFEGQTPRGQKCELRVIETFHEDDSDQWEDFRAEVTTSFAHGNDKPGTFELSPGDKTRKLLTGDDGKGSKFRLVLGNEALFESATAFSLRWKHVNHYHTFLCQKLKPRP